MSKKDDNHAKMNKEQKAYFLALRAQQAQEKANADAAKKAEEAAAQTNS